LIWLPYSYLVWSIIEAVHCALVSSLLSLLCWIQMFSSYASLNTPSIYVLSVRYRSSFILLQVNG
jgi:hypothetical protein